MSQLMPSVLIVVIDAQLGYTIHPLYLEMKQIWMYHMPHGNKTPPWMNLMHPFFK